MSPNNQNEYEIIDATPSTSVSNDSSRYPFANEPTNALQNMNYKDYLRMSKSYNSEFTNNYEAFISTGSAIGTGLKILGSVFGFLGVPGASAVGSILGAVIPLLFPGPDPWEAFMAQVEELINQKITENTRNTALARLQGLSNAVAVYAESLERFLENPNDTRLRSVVQTQYIALEIDFVNAMPLFAISGQEVPLLAVYAQAAGLHLMLLRDATLHGEAIGLTQSEITGYYNRQVEYTAQYTDYCVKWYRTGLNRLIGTNAEQWIKYNRFRREMTIMVLDTIYLYPFYDPHLYPLETIGKLTRKIYTDPLGFSITGISGSRPPWFNHARSFSDIENAAISPPGFAERLDQLQIYTRQSNDANFRKHYWAGHLVTYETNAGSNSKTYGDVSNSTSSQNISLLNQDVYRVRSTMTTYWNLLNAPHNLMVVKAQFDKININNGLSTTNYVAANESYGYVDERDSSDEIPLLIEPPTEYGNFDEYTHRLSSVTIAPLQSNSYGLVPVLGWTHTSANVGQRFQADPERITQYPMVMVHRSVSDTSVAAGPGFTGGDILRRIGPGTVGSFLFDQPTSSQRYRVRIRYAATADLDFYVLRNETNINNSRFKKTMNAGETLTYKSFKFAEFSSSFQFMEHSTYLTINVRNFSSGQEVYIDRMELIPVDATYEAEQDLETAKKAVNALFTNTKDGLRPGVTDYEVNQAANLVECISDDLYPNEKRLLFDAVREAKRLSEARNLLQDPDFQEINGENGWTASTGVEIIEGDAVFKGRYLRLPGAREIDTETYPTYVYQKIEEGVLKPYTRYRLRGFVGSSQGLEIYTIRHQTNRIVKNVPDDLIPDVTSVNTGGGINRCSEQKYVNSRLEGERGLPNGNRSAEAHEFSLPIDIGELDYNENAGIWVGFKITDPEGYATLGNLELVEEGPLSGDALERLQREEQQWKLQMTKRREETDRKYTAAKQAVDRLYADYQDQQLNPNVEITDITAAQDLIQSIPYVYNEIFPEIQGMNYAKFTELSNRLQRAWGLYDQRNAIPNGDFRNGLSNWNTTPGVEVQQINDTSVLVIPNWDEQVSQQFTVQPNQRYVLRVTARKEGVGNGYVSIRDGGNQTETLTFSASDYDTNNVYNTQASNTNGYNTNSAYNTQVSNTNGYNTNNAYNTNEYNTQASNTNGLYNEQTGYITKTVTFIPYTDKVWIEMSETEGTFYIESVELIVDVE
ncbi:insecticidal delta-endotoxin Cry8Ea1 family protein [Bacillus cereus]|nr:insecticidal delta-endotoxin Cry8Ea1 family protein [Bacillus cereus]MEC2742672.1 insecticidal delta-endotoxin Cry8Ea1 family protein [Bacillus cereus]MEC2757699.1 insecticidal delta-endotoxin Cry8Ea1 family protein [Bacillus cereus]MEC2829998.1 insecticidal delta-endotoxin Cry8Ea1 family protein [Bacillus cereus]